MSENTIVISKLRKVLQRFNEDYSNSVWEKDKHRLGQVLTVIDSALQDPEQRKATKDLINNIWYGDAQMSFFNVHSEIRKATEALGFELYPESEQPPINVQVSEYNRYLDLVK